MRPSHKRPQEHPKTAAEGQGLADRPWLRRLIGVAVVLHLTAVAVAPFAELAPPREEPPGGGPVRPGATAEAASRTAGDLPAEIPDEQRPVIHRIEKSVFRPYLDLLYLNHGYRFFAPEPGPSYVMEYEVHREDGRVIRRRLPDLDRHRPRLLYHRYFMLATQNVDLVGGTILRGKVSVDSTNTLAYAILRQAMERHGAERGVLRLYTHRLLWPEEVLQGKSPDDPDTYIFQAQIALPPSSQAADANGTPASMPAAEEVSP